MKKLAFLGLTLLLLFVCAVCACAQNGDVRIVDHVVYQLETADGESSWTVVSLFDSKKAKQTVKEITIREEIDGIPVCAIEPTASWDEGPDGELIWDPAAPDYFVSADDAACESITIPPSVKTIGAFSFPCMTRLQSVLLPDSVEEIGAYAFCNCTALREIRLPASLRTIGRNAFNRCATLEAVRIPDGVTTLGSSSFAMCGQLSDVQLGAGLETIGDNAFGACAKLTAVAFPASLEAIERNAFYDTALTEVTIPAVCKSFSFESLPLLRRVVIEDRTATLTLPPFAFANCRSLQEVTLPKSGRVKVGYYAFSNCKKLKTVDNAASIASIGSAAFQHCKSLAAVSFSDNLKTIDRAAFRGCKSLQKLSLPQSLRRIRSSAFANCTALETVRIPDRITVLENDTFRGCSELKRVRLSQGLTALEQGVFADCAKLERIALPDTLRTVCRDAFLNTAIVELTVPAACGTFWFNGMAKLKQVTLEDRTGKLTIPSSCFSGLRALEQVTLPKRAKVTIGSGAFARCVRLTKIQNSGAIVSVRPKAFYGCKALPALTLSGRLRRLDGSALLHCDSLSKLRFTGTSAAFLSADSDFLQTLPESCKLYVRTNAMKQASVAKGCTNPVIIKRDLK